MAGLTHILHVEDDADIVEVARMSLELLGGFRLNQFTSGAAAVAAAPGLHPDLLLLDMMMPGMDGWQTLLRLRDVPHLREVPAIFMTAKLAGLPDAAAFAEQHVIGTVEKPFDAMALPGQLSAMWDRACAQPAFP